MGKKQSTNWWRISEPSKVPQVFTLHIRPGGVMLRRKLNQQNHVNGNDCFGRITRTYCCVNILFSTHTCSEYSMCCPLPKAPMRLISSKHQMCCFCTTCTNETANLILQIEAMEHWYSWATYWKPYWIKLDHFPKNMGWTKPSKGKPITT